MAAEKPKRRLKNLVVEYISLVDAGANRRQVVYKNAAAGTGTRVNTSFAVRKVDEDKRLVYGIVYAPDETDTQGDTMEAAEIEKAAHEFLAAGRTANVDKQHNQQADKGLVVESYILGEDDERFPDDPAGAWAVVIKVTDDDTWAEIKKGDLKGISMQGLAEEEVLQETKKNFTLTPLIEKFEELNRVMKQLFKTSKRQDFNEWQQDIAGGSAPFEVTKDFKARLGYEQFRNAVSALDSANWQAIGPEAEGDVKTALKENAQQFIAHLDEITISKTKKEDTPMAEEKPQTSEQTKPAEEKEVLKAIADLQKEVNTKIDGLSARLETVEKNAGGSQADEGQEKPGKVEKTESKGLKFF